MVTLTLTGNQTNAAKAALALRSMQLAEQLARLRGHPQSASRDFAIETTEEAIRDSISTLLAIEAAEEIPEYPPEMTVARLAETLTRYQWGDK